MRKSRKRPDTYSARTWLRNVSCLEIATRKKVRRVGTRRREVVSAASPDTVPSQLRISVRVLDLLHTVKSSILGCGELEEAKNAF